MNNTSLAALALLLVATSVGDMRAQAANSPAAVAKQYCVSCHNATAKAGDLVLDGAPPSDVPRWMAGPPRILRGPGGT